MSEQELRERIVAAAQSWIGTPYVLGARVKGAGCDCATLILGVFQEAGLVPPDEEAHRLSPDWWHHTGEERYRLRVLRHCAKTVEAVTYRTLQARPGDILLLKAANSRLHNHGGIVLAWPRVLHAAQAGVESIDATKHPMWAFQTVEVYAPRGAAA